MMYVSKNLLIILVLHLFFTCIYGKDEEKTNHTIILPDTANIYKELLQDETDDLMENHPADDLYHRIWTCEKLNPYKISIDNLPDSIQIDLSDYHHPAPGRITSHFGARRYRYHFGTDIKLFTGDSVVSSFSGKVRIIDYERRGYGHYVVIRHDNGLETVYAHLSKVLVSLDQIVCAGQVIALGGNTGRSTGSHLHYEIRFLGNAINPTKVIDFAARKPFQEDYLVTKKETFYHQKELKALAAAKFYKIKRGDNLSTIAARNGTSVRNLCRLNGISSSRILRIGQVIRIR